MEAAEWMEALDAGGKKKNWLMRWRSLHVVASSEAVPTAVLHGPGSGANCCSAQQEAAQAAVTKKGKRTHKKLKASNKTKENI